MTKIYYFFIFAVVALIIGLFAYNVVTYFYNVQKSDNLAIPVVKLYNETGGRSSAVHIGRGYFLTVSHAFSDDQEVLGLETNKGDSISADVIWNSKSYDIALLHSELYQNVKIDYYEIDCSRLKVGDKLSFIGNPTHVDFAKSWGRVSTEKTQDVNIWRSVLVVNGSIIPGMSGGAAIDDRNRLRGINVGLLTHQTGNSMMGPIRTFTNFSYIVPSDDICFLIGRS